MKRDLCLGVVLLILFASPCFGQTSPGAADVAFTITRMAEIYHVQPRTVDRNFSADLYTQMIFALDPDKIYFTAEEIQILDKWKYLLDQQLLNRKIDFLNQLTAIYARKINQTDSILDKLSVTPFNLQIKESFSISEDSSFASNEPQRRIKLYKLVRRNTIESILDMQEADSASSRLKPETLEPGQRKKICHSFKRDLERNRQTKGGLAGYIGNAWCESVASCYDPHTEFFSASKKEDFEGELGEKPMQFGFSLGEGKGATEITRLKPGSPAYRSGLIHEGDQIVALQWDANEVVDVSDGSAEEVNAFISGDHGKDLTLTLKKSDGSTLKVTLQREKAALDDDNSKVQMSWGANTKIIYRKVGSFAQAWGFGFDLGFMYKTPTWRLGVAARDITTTFNAWSFSFSDREKEALYLTNNDIPVRSTELTAPTLVLGGAYNFKFADKFHLLTEANLNLTFDGKRNTLLSADPVSIDPKFGLEANINDVLFIRAGVSNFQQALADGDTLNQKKVWIFQPSIGAGFKIGNVTIDYAFSNLANQGNPLYSHIFSLRLDLLPKSKTVKEKKNDGVPLLPKPDKPKKQKLYYPG